MGMAQHSAVDGAHLDQILASVADPEIPVISIVDLGIVRQRRCDAAGVEVGLTSTYSGCPATDVIRSLVHEALASTRCRARVRMILNPPWTTEWISVSGDASSPSTASCRRVARTARAARQRTSTTNRSHVHAAAPPIPNSLSEFGSTPCKVALSLPRLSASPSNASSACELTTRAAVPLAASHRQASGDRNARVVLTFESAARAARRFSLSRRPASRPASHSKRRGNAAHVFDLSSPGQTSLSICVRLVPGGRFSGFVAEHLRPGDQLDVLMPNGSFHAAPARRGLAPCRLRGGHRHHARDVRLSGICSSAKPTAGSCCSMAIAMRIRFCSSRSCRHSRTAT